MRNAIVLRIHQCDAAGAMTSTPASPSYTPKSPRRPCADNLTPVRRRPSLHGIHQLIVIGLIAHTCIEATVRYAAELGYDVTVVRDATADYSEEMMHAALDINLPNYAGAIPVRSLPRSRAAKVMDPAQASS